MTGTDILCKVAGLRADVKGGPSIKWLQIAAELSLYLLAACLFTAKGNGLRSVGIYVPPVALLLISLLSRTFPFRRKDFLLWGLIAFSGSALLSSLMAPDPAASLDVFGKNFVKLLLVAPALCIFFGDRRRLDRLCSLFAFVAVAMTVLTFYDFLTKGILPDGKIEFEESARRYSVILDFLVPFIPLVLVRARTRSIKLLWFAAMTFGFVAMLLTGARGGWVGLVVGLCVWVVALIVTKRVPLRQIGLAALALIGIIAISLAVIPSSHISKRIHKGFTTTKRVDRQWKGLLENYGALPAYRKVIGMGLDRTLMFADFDRWFSKHYRKPRPVNKIPPNPHNLTLFTLYTQGIIGMLLYLALLAAMGASLIRKIRRAVSPETTLIGVSIFAAFLGSQVVHGLVEDLRLMPLGFLLGMAAAYLRIDDADSPPTAANIPTGVGSEDGRSALRPGNA